jgi:hypothetical protein
MIKKIISVLSSSSEISINSKVLDLVFQIPTTATIKHFRRRSLTPTAKLRTRESSRRRSLTPTTSVIRSSFRRHSCINTIGNRFYESTDSCLSVSSVSTTSCCSSRRNSGVLSRIFYAAKQLEQDFHAEDRGSLIDTFIKLFKVVSLRRLTGEAAVKTKVFSSLPSAFEGFSSPVGLYSDIVAYGFFAAYEDGYPSSWDTDFDMNMVIDTTIPVRKLAALKENIMKILRDVSDEFATEGIEFEVKDFTLKLLRDLKRERVESYGGMLFAIYVSDKVRPIEGTMALVKSEDGFFCRDVDKAVTPYDIRVADDFLRILRHVSVTTPEEINQDLMAYCIKIIEGKDIKYKMRFDGYIRSDARFRKALVNWMQAYAAFVFNLGDNPHKPSSTIRQAASIGDNSLNWRAPVKAIMKRVTDYRKRSPFPFRRDQKKLAGQTVLFNNMVDE